LGNFTQKAEKGEKLITTKHRANHRASQLLQLKKEKKKLNLDDRNQMGVKRLLRMPSL
jgi:hypothetical protein